VNTKGEIIDVADRFPGLAGTSSRFTTDVEWRRTFIVPAGWY